MKSVRVVPLIYCVLFALSTVVAGCDSSAVRPSPRTLTESQQKFLDICKDEHSLSVRVRSFPRTFWVYVPVEHRLIDYKSTKDGPQKSNERSEKFSLNYLDGRFQNGAFELEYDVSRAANYSVSYGYSSIYTDEYQQTQHKIMSALYQAYAEIYDADRVAKKSFEDKAQTYEDFLQAPGNENSPPDFVVLIVADVKKGIELMSMFAFDDFFRAMVDPYTMPQEEFSRRNITELRGKDAIIDDYEGDHVEYRDVTWPEFLTQQMINRLRFKYQYSDFKPDEDPEEEIMKVVAKTIEVYHFKDFTAISLYNLATKSPYRFTPEQLKSFLEE